MATSKSSEHLNEKQLKIRIFMFALSTPILAVGQSAQEGKYNKVLIMAALVLILMVGLLFLPKTIIRLRNKNLGRHFRFAHKRLEISITQDKIVRPRNLTMYVKNTGKRDIDLHPPMLVFQKLWTKRKFILPSINSKMVYPLYLEKGKSFKAPVDLTKIWAYDKRIKKFYWGRIIFTDTKGKVYKSPYVTLRKSLYT